MKNHQNADVKLPLIDLEADNNATGRKQDVISGQRERLSEGDNMYCLYWIHLSDHISIEQGYIGITLDFKKRMFSHKRSKEKTHFKNAILKYGYDNLIKEILHSNLNLEEALFLENKYRPTQNIGWNSKKGGILGVEKEWYLIQENKDKHSLNTSVATKEWILKNDTKEKRSLRAKENWKNNAESYKGSNKGSKNSRAILNETQVLCIKCKLLKEGIKDYKIAKIYNVKPYVINFIRKNINWKHIICDSPDPNENCYCNS
jgi:predicted GIY-YIG superfamily endonuclease